MTLPMRRAHVGIPEKEFHFMKKLSLILVSALCLLMLTALISCTDGDLPSADTSAETWVCDCGNANTGKFCSECGTQKPTEESATDTDSRQETAEGTEPTTEAATDGETVTEAATEDNPEETEPVTRAPRYDYMGAEVAPDVTIDKSQYTNLTLTLPAYLQVTHEDVMAYIQNICFQYRTADNGSEQVKDQPMKWGDDAYIYYKGVLNGEEFEGGSNWEDEVPYTLGLGSGAFIPGFEEGLVGIVPANATKDSPAEIHVTFPENYAPELAGKDVVFYVAVEYAVQYTMPTYTRDFVENTLKYQGQKDFYAGDAAYLEEFEDYVREYLESERAEDLHYAKIDALWNHLTEAASCQNLPQMELDYYYQAYVDEIEYYYDYYKSYGGSSFTESYPTLDDFAKSYVGVEADGDWKAELSSLSANMVRKDMIGHAIAEMEGMETVTDEEYKAEIQYWVDSYQGYMTADEIVANMGEAVLRESAFAQKMQTWLLEQVTFRFETESVK